MRIINTTICMALLLSGCSFTPDYKVPEVKGADLFKEMSPYEAQWKPASPQAGKVDQKKWWTLYGDKRLNALEEKVLKNNPELQAAAARVDQASALLAKTKSSLFPTITANGAATTQDNGKDEKSTRDYDVFGSISYGVDIFGRVRAASRAANLDKQQYQALYDQVLLLLQSNLAQSYFILASLDTEIDLLQKTVALREKSFSLVEKRFQEGEENEQNTLRAKADLANTRAELSFVQQKRALTEHALAILLGEAPSQTLLASQKLPAILPTIPAGLPSAVLERRPDIAAAQLNMAAANERIGLARAAFFPSISLTGQGGFSSSDLNNIFDWSSRAWTFGPTISLPLFEGGRRVADLNLSKASFQESLAVYRQKVLVAFQEVEDTLSSLRLLSTRLDHLRQAVTAAKKAAKISELRYHEGEAPYLEVLDTQRDLLAAQRAYSQTRGELFTTTVQLIRVLGGGW
jgi:multidrug efflux system outer membrane protein